MLYYAVFIDMNLEHASYYIILAKTTASIINTLEEHIHLRCAYVLLMQSPSLSDLSKYGYISYLLICIFLYLYFILFSSLLFIFYFILFLYLFTFIFYFIIFFI